MTTGMYSSANLQEFFLLTEGIQFHNEFSEVPEDMLIPGNEHVM